MKRKIVMIDQDKCNGCGLCVDACHEGAIELVDGKARLVGDEYCDGLGDCLPACPTGAITIEEREAKPFDEELVKKKMAERAKAKLPCGCPGTLSRTFTPKSSARAHVPSELGQWPVQLHLLNPAASFFQGAHLLIAADCAAYAYGNFHQDFISGRIVAIGCPKLDDLQAYLEKLTAIFLHHDLASVTVVRMEVPCCGGIVRAVRAAMEAAGAEIPYREVVIGTQGNIVSDQTI
ncbi:MAG: 4Fe-4S dicluster domain-containing protein [Firmicutes bacterium]|jgi:ferredoxin|nr:4Fe-4S dicluster domain-containing protein [Bacillota bacterium]HQD39039.1 4Fe-4S dicluster domain-containing protein [Bacillota bacterium]